MLWQHTKQDAVKKFFPLPNEIFSLGLSPGGAGCLFLSALLRRPQNLSVLAQLQEYR